MGFSPPRSVILGTVTALAAVAAPAAAVAAKPLTSLPAKSATVRVASVERQSCVVRSLTGRGVARLNVKAPVRGTISVRTWGARSADWDMAIVDRRTKRVLTGSAELASNEYAATFVAKG